MSNEIKNRVKQVLVNKILKDMSPEDIGDDTSLIELGVGVDSVATLELIVALEKEFQISIDESDVNPELLATVDSIAAYISERM
ncbi:MAG TPA: acyl carrier protein [Thermodesulfobacteriota bacterium]|nr:acyl carrier protein [Thermodesulfobacteriota bacterium]